MSCRKSAWRRRARHRTAVRNGAAARFGRCKLLYRRCRTDSTIEAPQSLQGKRIATILSHILERFLADRGIARGGRVLSGSVEIAPRAWASGFDMRSRVDGIDAGSESSAPGRDGARKPGRADPHTGADRSGKAGVDPAPVDAHRRRRAGQGQQVHHAACARSALPAIAKLLPGSEAPTVIPLEGRGDRVAVHAVCRENVFWETLEELKGAGATSVLVLPVEKMLA